MKKLLLPFIATLGFSALVQAQTGISASGAAPHASAMLDVSATNHGFLTPRVALVARNNSTTPIASPAQGLLVYNTATANTGAAAPPNDISPGFYYWDTDVSLWQRLMAGYGSFTTGTGAAGYVTYWTGANTLGYDNDANGQFYYDAATNSLGLGTTSPSTPVHAYRSLSNTAVQDMLRIEGVRSDFVTTPAGLSILFKDQDGNNATNEARIKMMTVNDVDYGDDDEAASNLLFETTNGGVASDKMIITGRGNIGIGTTNPAQLLDVNGVINSATGYRYANTNQTAGTYLRSNGTNFVPSAIQDSDLPTGSGNYIQNQILADQNAGFRISSDGLFNGGNVAIGSATAPHRLFTTGGRAYFVTSTATDPFTIARLYKTTNFEEIQVGVTDAVATVHYINDEAASELRFRLQNTDTEANGGANASDHTIMTLRGSQTGGNVGIGITTPAFKLDVSSYTRLGTSEVGSWPVNSAYAFFGHEALDHSAAGNYALLQHSGGTTYLNSATGTPINFRHGNIDQMVLTAGNLGIGNTGPAQKLDVSGVTRTREGIEINSGSVTTDSNYGIYFHGSGDRAYSIYRESGAWNSPYPDLHIAFHTGIKLGAHASYNGIRFYNNHDMATLVMSVNDASTGGAGNVYMENNLRVNGLAGTGTSIVSVTSNGTLVRGGSGLSVSGEYNLTSGGNGETTSNMTAVSNSFCYLTRTWVRETDSGDEMAGCRIINSGGTWQLRAYKQNSDAYAECTARCVSW
jgi:hypothetical protein